MMSETDQVLAIPLWINGRAYLTIAPAFFDVRDAASGEIKRRTPLCGASEALAAATSAQAALPDWAARTVAERAALLLALADALAEYGEHFAALISEESGKDAALAAAEVGDALSLLRGASPGAASDTGNSGSAAKCRRGHRQRRQRATPRPVAARRPGTAGGRDGHRQAEPESAISRFRTGRTERSQRFPWRCFQRSARRPGGYRRSLCAQRGQPAVLCRRSGAGRQSCRTRLPLRQALRGLS
jgi:hypothetical protein